MNMSKILKVLIQQNAITEGDLREQRVKVRACKWNLEECRDNDKNSQRRVLSFKCILARNCEGTEQLHKILYIS